VLVHGHIYSNFEAIKILSLKLKGKFSDKYVNIMIFCAKFTENVQRVAVAM